MQKPIAQGADSNYGKPLLVIVAELASLISALGFLCAIAINMATFEAWGLNFLQVATLSDVVFTALATIWDIGIVAAVALAIGLPIISVAKTARRSLAFALVAISFLLLVVFVLPFGSLHFPPWLLLGFLVFGLTVVPILFALSYLLGRRVEWAPRAARLATITAVIIACALVPLMLPHVGFRLAQGTTPRGVLIANIPGCAERAFVHWIGERFSVVRCGPSGIILVNTPSLTKVQIVR